MNDKTIENNKDQQTIPVPTLDYDEYRADWAEYELTTEQENELLATLWNIMCTMCDIGWGMDAVQMIMPTLLHSAVDNETDGETNTAAHPLIKTTDTQSNKRSKSDG